jgi:NifU-like protein involved in Fe-S cluster formation
MDYGPVVRQHFSSPCGAGLLEQGSAGLAAGEAADRTLNVWVRFQVETAGGVIRRARFQAFGCPHTLAAASWVVGWLEGRESTALVAVDARELLRIVEAPVEKLGRLLLIEDALVRCANDLQSENSEPHGQVEENVDGHITDAERG